MYIEDKEEFRKQMLCFSENWLDESKVSDVVDMAFANSYMSPSAPYFYIMVRKHEIDEYYTNEACEFFHDNVNNPHMVEFYKDQIFTFRIMELVGIDPDESDSAERWVSVLSWLAGRFGEHFDDVSCEDLENAIKNEYLSNQ